MGGDIKCGLPARWHPHRAQVSPVSPTPRGQDFGGIKEGKRTEITGPRVHL